MQQLDLSHFNAFYSHLIERSPNTPVVLGHKMGCKDENVKLITLAGLASELADMQTVIIVGSSNTKILELDDRLQVYTPRKHD